MTAPNIALVKYWGKYDEDSILPLNDSISLTLNSEDLKTTTTVILATDIAQDELILNGQATPLTPRVARMLARARQRAVEQSRREGKPTEPIEGSRFRITSGNSFPTASGLASSASGLSALALCLDRLLQLRESWASLSESARLGSGSASRSIFGGLVEWKGVPPSAFCQLPPASELERLSK